MNKHRDAGFTLVELMAVVLIFSVFVGAMYSMLNLVSRGAADSVENSTGAEDLSYQLEIISKLVMQSELLYASDSLIVLRQPKGTAFRVNAISVSTTSTPDGPAGVLTLERWETDPAGMTALANGHSTWVIMSTRNGNVLTTPPTPLFTYYTSALDGSALGSADTTTALDTSCSSFLGTLPGAYNVGNITRVRVHVLSKVSKDLTHSDTRDVAVRIQ